mgnify:FL=1
MHDYPTLAIVGRPNVGKSSLFNVICKKKISIVEEEEGITRDTICHLTEFDDIPFYVMDTGGIAKEGVFLEQIRSQALEAIAKADVIALVIDGKVGLTTQDQEVAKLLLQKKKPTILVINKMDRVSDEAMGYRCLNCGIQEFVFTSTIEDRGIEELQTRVTNHWKDKPISAKAEIKPISVALIGRTNVGKSTLFNGLLQESRAIVSPIAGTTRDSIDVTMQWKDLFFTFIDTAGIRKKHKERNVIEKFASLRTWKAIDRSDICIILIDCLSGITTQEKRFIHQVEKRGKGCIIFINKWDLSDGHCMQQTLRVLQNEIPFIKCCPVFFGSAKTMRNVDKIFPALQSVMENFERRISTGKLNSFLVRMMKNYSPPMIKGKRLRIYYITQVKNCPPHFIFFVNDPERVTDGYKRYLFNHLRKEFDFLGVPLHSSIKAKPTLRERSQAHNKKFEDLIFAGEEPTTELPQATL